METTGKKFGERIELLKPIEVKLYMEKFPEGQRFDVQITKAGTLISERHRKFYFGGVIRPAAEHFKVDPARLHEYFKHTLVMELEELKGGVFSTTKSLGKMNSKEATTYIENVRMELRNPDNLFGESFDTEDPEEYYARIQEDTKNTNHLVDKHKDIGLEDIYIEEKNEREML